MADAAVISKVAVLLLLIRLLLLLWGSICVWSVFRCVLLCFLSSFAVILMGKRESFWFCSCYCSVALANGAVV